MKSIAFFNNKGGVSKTTSVVNIGYILGEIYKRKVLIVDCDGQQNASRFLANTLSDTGIEKTFTDKTVTPASSLVNTRYENIDVLTSTSEMNNCCEKFLSLDVSEQDYNLKKLVDFWKDRYDYVLLDMPPALNYLTESIISITDGVIVPVELGTFSIQGISKVTDSINKVGASFNGCFTSKFDKKNKADYELKKLMEHNLGSKVFDTMIPYSNVIRNSIDCLIDSNFISRVVGEN